MLTLEARVAVREDVAQLIELLPQISSRPEGLPAQTPPLEEALEIFDRIDKSENVRLIVVEDTAAGQLLAVLTLAIVPNLTYGGRPWSIVENGGVRRGHRGKGSGKRLMAYAFETAEAAGCYKVQVLSGPKEDQVGYYRSVGFVDGTSVGFKKHLVDRG